MKIITMFNLFRTIMYLWVAGESLNLAYIYHFGYDGIKRSPIIQTLFLLFFFLGLFFLALSFLPVLKISNNDLYLQATDLLILFTLPLAYLLRRFRLDSITKNHKTKKYGESL